MERPSLPSNDRSIRMSWTESGDLKIVWQDEHKSVYSPQYLRRLCPCAHCRLMPRNERGELRIVLLPNLKIDSVEGVGNYGVSFTFSDGHHFGIYPYRYLRGLCPCESCARGREGTVD
ncbi:MAG: gamma-butyrobetaine hydroxylase-like domain-containing protein [bacterium JZ-2024 1]